VDGTRYLAEWICFFVIFLLLLLCADGGNGALIKRTFWNLVRYSLAMCHFAVKCAIAAFFAEKALVFALKQFFPEIS